MKEDGISTFTARRRTKNSSKRIGLNKNILNYVHVVLHFVDLAMFFDAKNILIKIAVNQVVAEFA